MSQGFGILTEDIMWPGDATAKLLAAVSAYQPKAYQKFQDFFNKYFKK